MSNIVHRKYFASNLRVTKMTRPELISFVKRALPNYRKYEISLTAKTDVIRNQVFALLRLARDRALQSLAKRAVPELPTITQAELNEFFGFTTITWDEIRAGILSELSGRPMPYYVTGVAKYPTTERQMKWLSLIENADDLKDFITEANKFIFEYGVDDAPTEFHLKITPPYDDETPEIIRVANYSAENCVINVIRNMESKYVATIYKKYPELKPTPKPLLFDPSVRPDPIYIDHQKIADIARTCQIKINIYSALAAKMPNDIRPVWHSFGPRNAKGFHMQIACEHATIMPTGVKPSRVIYHDPANFELPSAINVVDHCYSDEGPLKFYITLTDGVATIHKVFRPSSVDNIVDRDSDSGYFMAFDANHVLFRLFKEKYQLSAISDDSLRSITKAAEHFVGKRVLTALNANSYYTEYDLNKAYISYEKNPYYCGFPTNTLIPMKLEHSTSPAFVVCSNIEDIPESFHTIFNYPGGRMVLAGPMYQYLKDIGADITVDYVLVAGSMQHISVFDFANSFAIPETDKKLFRNSLIGRTISGGCKESKKISVRYLNDNERDQILLECQTSGYLHGHHATSKRIDVEIPNSTRGLFNFHSYILAYTAISVMRKWAELESSGHPVVAYNVDALVVEGKFSDSSDEIGEWNIARPIAQKRTAGIKSYYFALGVDREIAAFEHPILPSLTIPNRPIPSSNTLITGAAGISKSYPWVSDPAHDQIVLTPTRGLRNEHCSKFPNTETAHKYFQFGVDDESWEELRRMGKIPRAHSIVVVDEYSMFTADQWDIMRSRAGSSIIVAIGDPCQISSAIEGTPVDLEYFSDFRRVEITRTPEGFARHSYDYGCKLDQLRTAEDPVKLAIDLFGIRSFRIRDCNIATDRVIVGTHAIANEFNSRARMHLGGIARIRCRNIFDHAITKDLDTNSKDIWWNFAAFDAITNHPPKSNGYGYRFGNYPTTYKFKWQPVGLSQVDFDRIRDETALFPCKSRAEKGKDTVHALRPITSKDIWWGRTCMDDQPPAGTKWEPDFAVTSDSRQGATVESNIFVHAKSLVRHGTFYTAMTRTREQNNTIIIY